MSGPLSPVARPDGRLYRPRKIVAYAVGDDMDCVTAVLVLGTHDQERAFPLADAEARSQLGSNWTAYYAGTGWYRDSYDGNGERCWVADLVRGRAGVWFRVEEVWPPQ